MVNLYWWKPAGGSSRVARELVTSGRAWAWWLAKGRRTFFNFGDAYSVDAVRSILRTEVRYSRARDADLIAVGSILDSMTQNDHSLVWGSGARGLPPIEELKVLQRRTSDVLAVRGHLTAEVLGLNESIALGDPGILASSVYAPVSAPADRPIYIPHFRTPMLREGRELIGRLNAHGFRIVPPTLKPEIVAAACANAPYVVTSSLHGQIFADSFHRPNIRIEFENSGEPEFKFQDYESIYSQKGVVVRAASASVLTLNSLIDSAQEVAESRARELPTVQSKLASALRQSSLNR